MDLRQYASWCRQRQLRLFAADRAGHPQGGKVVTIPLAPRTARAIGLAILAGQVPGSVLDWVKVIDEPASLTVGVCSVSDPGALTARRAAVAVPFALGVRKPAGRPDILTGVLAWAAVGLDRPGARQDRVWLDFGMTRERAEELLQPRVREVSRTG